MSRVVLAGDQLVDEPGRWCTGSGHQGGSDAIGFDGCSGQGGDRMLIEIGGHDDASLRCSQPVQLSSDLTRLDEKVPRIEPHGAESDTSDLDGEVDCGLDVVGVDEKRGARTHTGDLSLERGSLVVVQQGERVGAGAGGGDSVGASG